MLQLCCQNHPDTHTLVSKASDFQKVPEGGCSLPCEFRLGCGHVCTRACHPYDCSHKEFQCMKPCQKVICPDGHRCPLVCFQECEPCQVKVPKTIARCGHKQMVPCSVPESDFCCEEPCPKVLRCGHRCSHPCGEGCVQLCPEMVTVKLKCGHNQQVKCGNVEDLKYDLPVECTTKCGTILDCGHPCPGSCHSCFEGRFHQRCQQPCKAPAHLLTQVPGAMHRRMPALPADMSEPLCPQPVQEEVRGTVQPLRGTLCLALPALPVH